MYHNIKLAVGSEQCWFELPWVADRQTDWRTDKNQKNDPLQLPSVAAAAVLD